MASDYVTANPIRVWALLGDHRGDNNQVLALAEGLGLPFEAKLLEYHKKVRKGFWAARGRWLLRALPPSLIGLKRQSREMLAGTPPDLVIAIGSRTAPIIRVLQRRSRGRMLSVQLGNPRIAPRHFDLVITTPQYPVPDAPNVIRLPISIGRDAAVAPTSEAEREILAALPSPRRLLLLGGPSGFWRVDPDDVAAVIGTLAAEQQAKGGSLVVLPSPRTPPAALVAAEAAVRNATGPAILAPLNGPPSYARMLDAADVIYVTADSVAMISEAIRTGKPIGLVPVRTTDWGAARLARHDRRKPNTPIYPRDLRFFWATLQQRGLVGTVEAPAAGDCPDVNAIAVELVRRLLAPADPLATGNRDSGPSASPSPGEHIRA